MRQILLLVVLLMTLAHPAAAQWSVGPQVGGLGVGGSVTRTAFFGYLSLSGEIGLAPVGTTNATIKGVQYALEPTVIGGLLMANLHPFQSSFSVGAGYLLGGYQAAARTPETEGAYALDGTTYTVDQYGPLTGSMELKGPVPAFLIGWRGTGFNFGIGVALTEPFVSLSADGARSGEAGFQSALAAERAEVEEALQLDLFGFRGIPLIRLGWELGL